MSISRRYLTKKASDGKSIISPNGKPVEDRSSPRYMVRIADRDPVTGKRRNITVGTFKTKREAEIEERKALTKRDTGTLLEPNKATVAELVGEWLKVKRHDVSPQTWAVYETTCRHRLLPALGTERVQKLTLDRVQAQYDQWIAQGVSPRMVQACHGRLSQALDWAVKRGLVVRNVARDAVLPRLPSPTAQVWDAAQAARFLDAVAGDDLNPVWHLLVLEGMRRGEALGLRWRDVNLERGTAHIVQSVGPDKPNRGATIISPTKTKASARTVKLTPDTIETLKVQRRLQAAQRLAAAEWHDHDLIVTTGDGTPVTPNDVNRRLDTLVEVTGLPRLRVHDLRHTSATLMLLAGVPAKIVSERLGHSKVGLTLDRYSHVLPSMQDAAAELMSDLLARTREA